MVDTAVVASIGATFEIRQRPVEPNPEAVAAILDQIGKGPNGRPWDCRACGFNTCQRFAEAAALGRASLRQCAPYQERRAEEAQRAAAVDWLTGLSTYRVLRDRLAFEIERSKRSSESFAVLFLDLDRFKQVNDQFGHEAGNDILRARGGRDPERGARVGRGGPVRWRRVRGDPHPHRSSGRHESSRSAPRRDRGDRAAAGLSGRADHREHRALRVRRQYARGRPAGDGRPGPVPCQGGWSQCGCLTATMLDPERREAVTGSFNPKTPGSTTAGPRRSRRCDPGSLGRAAGGEPAHQPRGDPLGAGGHHAAGRGERGPRAGAVRSQPKQLVRNIESALLAQLGLKIDHRKISIAQTADVKPIEALEREAVRDQVLQRAVLFENLTVAPGRRPHRILIAVTLSLPGPDRDRGRGERRIPRGAGSRARPRRR